MSLHERLVWRERSSSGARCEHLFDRAHGLEASLCRQVKGATRETWLPVKSPAMPCGTCRKKAETIAAYRVTP